MSAMHIGIVAINGCFSSGLTALLDILSVAEGSRADIDPSIPAITVDVLGRYRRVTTSAGLTIPTSGSLADLASVDVVVVAGLGTLNGADTVSALASSECSAVVRQLCDLGHRRSTVSAACTGVFALAEAGMLEQLRATTSWWAGPAFKRRYPGVTLDLDAMVVADEGTITAGAAFSHIDLALTLVSRTSSLLAEHVARLLVIDHRPAQSAYVVVEHLRHDDSLVRAFEQHARAHLHQPFDIGTVATTIGTSRRTLERRTNASLGMSPLALVQRLRVERATHLLRTTDQSIEQIAPHVGYANGSTLATLLRRLR